MTHSPGHQVSVATLLENLSREATRLAKMAGLLDGAVGDLLATEPPGASALLGRLQDMDALRQSLEAIAKISEAAAKEASAAPKLLLSKTALAEGITLAQTRDACLSGDGMEASAERSVSPANDAIFFDTF